MPRKSRKNVGLIGLGIIGTRVAQALRSGGFQVFVWNRTAKPAPNFLGSPAEVADICDVIQIFVSDSQALFEVIDAFGDALTANHVVVCNSTVGPEATVEAAKIVHGKGARFLDAPFTGSRLAAEKKQLVYYVGGDDSAFKKAEPFLKASSKGIIRCGDVGHAAVLKVVTNMITAVTTQTLAEALAVVKKSGISPDTFALALENNACRSGTTDIKLPKMVAAEYEPHFSLKHMFKDVQIAIHMANALDIEIPATTVTAGVMYGALNNGWADLDFASLFKLYDTSFAGPVEVIAPAEKSPPRIEAAKGEPTREPIVIEPEEVKPVTAEASVEEAKPADVLTVATPALSPEAPGHADALEVVTDVPKSAKPASDGKSDDASALDEPKPEGATEDAENGAEGTKKPFNRIKRFFFSPTGK